MSVYFFFRCHLDFKDFWHLNHSASDSGFRIQFTFERLFVIIFLNSGRLGHRHARVCVQLAEEQPDDFRTQIVLVRRPGVLGPRRKARSGRKRKGQPHLGGKAFL
jgi:hypothetical protein